MTAVLDPKAKAPADGTTQGASAPSTKPEPTAGRRPKSTPRPAPKPVQNATAWRLGINIVRMVSILCLTVVGAMLVISPIEHLMSQQRLYGQLRQQLAEGSLPRGPFTFPPVEEQTGDEEPQLILTPLGQPLALIEIPSLGVAEVIVEGTGSAQTAMGIGHKRDTVLPGQPGVSVLMGRQSMFGGPLGRLGELQVGDRFAVTTGQGRFEYVVESIRKPQSPNPPSLLAGESRLTIMTAYGQPFMPEDVLRLDARLDGQAKNPNGRVRAGTIPADEAAMSGAGAVTLVTVVFLVQALLVVGVLVVWLMRRWSKLKTWMVGAPVGLGLGILTAHQALLLLPNLM